MKQADLLAYGVRELNIVEMNEVSGGGSLIKWFWTAVSAAMASYGDTMHNERAMGGTSINWKY
jgi:hypothetical protein